MAEEIRSCMEFSYLDLRDKNERPLADLGLYVISVSDDNDYVIHYENGATIFLSKKQRGFPYDVRIIGRKTAINKAKSALEEFTKSKLEDSIVSHNKEAQRLEKYMIAGM